MVLLAIIILLAFLLQASGMLILFNIPCNLLLVTTICASGWLIPYKAGLLGFFSGFLLDVISIRHFGINTLSLTIVGILVSIFSKRVYPKIHILFSFVFLGTMLSGTISLILLFLFEGFLLNFFSILKEAWYNSILASLAFLFIKKRR